MEYDAGICKRANELAKEMIGSFLVEKAETNGPVVKKIWDEMQKEAFFLRTTARKRTRTLTTKVAIPMAMAPSFGCQRG